MDKEIVITDVIDLEVAFVKQEKQKAVSDKLTELLKGLDEYRFWYGAGIKADVVKYECIKQLFTEAGMK